MKSYPRFGNRGKLTLTEYARKADHGSTSAEIPTPEVLPRIRGPFILVRPKSEEEKTKGGVYLPEQAKDDVESITNIGEVVAIGDLAYVEPDPDKRRFGQNWCQVGDYVVWGKRGGQKITYRGVVMILLADDEILMTVENLEDINPRKNMVKW
jgi:co-chaperonin GroES (HSP10)